MAYSSTDLSEPIDIPAYDAAQDTDIPQRQAIALLSIGVDPAVDQSEEGRITGQRIHVRYMGEILAKLGWQVDIFTRKTNPHIPAIVQHSPYCRTIRLVAGAEVCLGRDRIFEHLPAFIEAFQTFQSKNTIYPLIHTHHWLSGWVGLQLMQASNVIWVHTCHSLAYAEYADLDAPPAIAQTRLTTEDAILERANRIIVTSPDELELVRSRVPNSSVRLIPGGADLSMFHRRPQAAARAALGLAPDLPIILYVGRFDARKGIETLLEACAVLHTQDLGYPSFSKFQLVLVGEAESANSQERDRLEGLIQDLDLAEFVYFAGRVSHHRLPLFYTAADVCVIPSRYEPFGLVALEAMACETPVVASNVGGLKFTVIPEETGLLVPVGDAHAFAEAIARVLHNPQWAEAVRTKASSYVQQTFSWTTAGAQLSDLYRRLFAESLMAMPQSNP